MDRALFRLRRAKAQQTAFKKVEYLFVYWWPLYIY